MNGTVMQYSIINLTSALHVADYMLATAKIDYDLELDQLQLNKLLYITNGFVLQEREEPAFHNPIEAWKYGPAIRIVWETFDYAGRNPIKYLSMCRTKLHNTEKVKGRRLDLLNITGEDVASVVGGVLKQYGRCTGGQLIDMTHKEGTPWSNTYKPGHDKIIPTALIADFYRHISKHNAR